MMVRPVPLLAQVCADEFALRRIARVVQTGLHLRRSAAAYVDWTPPKVAARGRDGLLAARRSSSRSSSGSPACQFWTGRLQRGRQRVHLRRQHDHAVPAHDLPAGAGRGADLRVPAGVRELVPLRSTSSTDPTRFGLPDWVQFASPVAALVLLGARGRSSGAPASATTARPGADMSLIEVRDLGAHVRRAPQGRPGAPRAAREVRAVRDLSFQVEAGEMVGYIGPNGAGKSTTIKMLTGILVPTGGHLAGRRPRAEPAPHRAGPPDRRGVRPAHHAVVGPAAARLLRAAAARCTASPTTATARNLDGVRRPARPRRPARHPGPPAQPRPADARRHRRRAAARPRDPLPRRADDRPRRREQGPAAGVPAHAQRGARHHPAADHPRPPGHRGALPPGDRHRPRHRWSSTARSTTCTGTAARPAPSWSTWSTRPPPIERPRRRRRGGSRGRASGWRSRPTPAPRRSSRPSPRRTTWPTCRSRSPPSRTSSASSTAAGRPLLLGGTFF